MYSGNGIIMSTTSAVQSTMPSDYNGGYIQDRRLTNRAIGPAGSSGGSSGRNEGSNDIPHNDIFEDKGKDSTTMRVIVPRACLMRGLRSDYAVPHLQLLWLHLFT